MKTATLKEPAPSRIRNTATTHPPAPPRPSIADWVKKNIGLVSTGIRDLSTREGFDD